MEKICKIFGIFGVTAFIVLTTVFLVSIVINMSKNALAQPHVSVQCKFYYDKAKQLAEESVEPLPQGITIDFDPRVAKSNSSIAYSQLYRNCKEWGE